MDNKDFREVIAHNLRSLRFTRHWNSAELANKASVAKATVSQLERGLANPTLETLWALAQALEVPFSALLEPGRAPLPVSAAVSDSHSSTALIAVYGQDPVTEVYRMEIRQGGRRDAVAHPAGVSEVVVALEGWAEVGTARSRHMLKRGDSTVFPADEDHFYTSVDGSCVLAVFVFYPPSGVPGHSWDEALRACQEMPGVYEGEIAALRAPEVWESNRLNWWCRTFLEAAPDPDQLHYVLIPGGRRLPPLEDAILEEERRMLAGPGLTLSGRTQDASGGAEELLRDAGVLSWVVASGVPAGRDLFRAAAAHLAPKGRLIVCASLLDPYRGRMSYIRQAALFAASEWLSRWPDGTVMLQASESQKWVETFVRAWQWDETALSSAKFSGQWPSRPRLPDGPRVMEMAMAAGFRVIRHRRAEGFVSTSEWSAGRHVFVFEMSAPAT